MRRLPPCLAVLPCLTAALGLPAAAEAGAPGWSTPHTASAVPVGIYGAGPNGQGVQLFGTSGASQSRTGEMRAITSDATQGSAVAVDAGGRSGFDVPAVAVNAGGKVVAAWSLDNLEPGPIGLAAALGARTALPRTAAVLPTTGDVQGVADAIAPDGTGVVAWTENGPGAVISIKAATLRPNQAPQVALLGTTTGTPALVQSLSVGMDAGGRPIVTWTSSTTTTGSPTAIDAARGNGSGAFAGVVEQPLTTAPGAQVQTFVQANGALTTMWSEGSAVRTASAPAGGLFGAARTVATKAQSGAPAFAGGSSGRVAAFYPTTSGLRITLRSSSGTWGSAHAVGPSGTRSVKRLQAGVDASGRVVILWDDGSAGAAPTRILAARSSSSSDPPGTYHQLPQRSGDKNCATPTLTLATSGDGLGSWLCNAGKSSGGQPRLARLTKAS
jgi:hypothetical protein